MTATDGACRSREDEGQLEDSGVLQAQAGERFRRTQTQEALRQGEHRNGVGAGGRKLPHVLAVTCSHS